MCIQPWVDITGETSPFVSIFESLGFQAAAAVFNVILITAALSAMNADVFGAGRMIHGLAEQGQAPHVFTRTTRNGVPIMTVLAMVVALLIGVVLNYFYPNQVLFLLGALATFATVLVWLVILVAHIRMKNEITREQKLPSEFPVPMWPVASYATVGFILFVIIMVGVVPHSRPALWVGLIWVALLTICYHVFVRGKGRKPHHLVDRTEPIQVVAREE